MLFLIVLATVLCVKWDSGLAMGIIPARTQGNTEIRMQTFITESFIIEHFVDCRTILLRHNLSLKLHFIGLPNGAMAQEVGVVPLQPVVPEVPVVGQPGGTGEIARERKLYLDYKVSIKAKLKF